MIKTIKNIFSVWGTPPRQLILAVMLIFSFSAILFLCGLNNYFDLFGNDDKNECINYNVYRAINPGYNKPLFDYFNDHYLINLSSLYGNNITTNVLSICTNNMWWDYIDLDYIKDNPAQFKNYITSYFFENERALNSDINYIFIYAEKVTIASITLTPILTICFGLSYFIIII